MWLREAEAGLVVCLGLVSADSIATEKTVMFGIVGLPGGAKYLIILLFCGLPLVALVVLLVFAFWLVQKRSGDHETRCRECGFILRGLTEPRCPECGERI